MSAHAGCWCLPPAFHHTFPSCTDLLGQDTALVFGITKRHLARFSSLCFCFLLIYLVWDLAQRAESGSCLSPLGPQCRPCTAWYGCDSAMATATGSGSFLATVPLPLTFWTSMLFHMHGGPSRTHPWGFLGTYSSAHWNCKVQRPVLGAVLPPQARGETHIV